MCEGGGEVCVWRGGGGVEVCVLDQTVTDPDT